MGKVNETMSYSAEGQELKGYLAFDDDAGPRPGVMVIHEWWGLDTYIRERTDRLAELGYTALALDMYGDGRTGGSPDEAGALMNGVLGDMESGTARLKSGYEALAAHPAADADRIAAIGYCFGGAMVLHMARIGMPLEAVVSFHGSLGSFHTPEPGTVKPRILVCHGAADSLVPDDDITAFKSEMSAAQAEFTFEEYDGALHGFTNKEATARGQAHGLPLAYDAQADEKSWASMQRLFNAVF